MTIREATVADVPDLVELGQRFRASTAYAGIVADNPEQMAKTATSLIEQDTGTVFVAEDAGGDVVAMIGLLLFVHHISGALTCGEVFWYAEAPNCGLALLHKAQQWARQHEATTIQMIQPMGEDRLGVLYARLGYRCIEAAWSLELKAQEAVA